MPRATAVTNATTIAVTRAFGRAVAAAMNIGDVLINIGTAFESAVVIVRVEEIDQRPRVI